MSISNDLTRRYDLQHPIIQAPMGGATTPDLVVAVCEAGALGFLAAAYLTPEQIARDTRAIRERTDRAFGINLFAPLPQPEVPADAARVLERLAPFHAELGIPAPTLPAGPGPGFDAQLAAVLESGATVFSFTFGIPPAAALDAARARGMSIIGTATTVGEAVLLEQAGCDAVVAQGSEAGAHRGTFAVPFEQGMVGTMALVPQVVDAVRIPVIASGGIMDGRGIAAALMLGASAVQMGTAFLTCDETSIAGAYRDALAGAREDETRLTRAFSGRAARGIVNRFMREVEPEDGEAAILPYPLQNGLSRPLRNAAATQGRPEYLSLWAGQGVPMARPQPAARLVARLAAETDAALRRFAPEG